MARKLEVEIVGDSSSLERALGRSGKASRSFGQQVKRGATVAGLALGAGLAVAAKVGFDELKQGQLVAAQTNAVLKSTGGVANVSAKEIDRMANAMLAKTGVDDEAIKTGANMLLTFTKIRNEVGAGNDVFNQATTAALNLSVAMGKDMQSSAILVGKALNDPIKGVTALTKAGIQLTQGQKDTIKSMVESGNVMGAQKIILAELTTQFGGSAEAAGKTMAGQINIAKESFSNLAAEIVSGALPAILSMTAAALTATRWLAEHPKHARILVVALAGLTVALLAAKAAQIAMNLAVLSNPYVAAAASIAIMSIGLVVLWRRYNEARDAIVLFTSKFSPLGAAVLFVKNHVDTFSAALGALRSAAAVALRPVSAGFQTLRSIVEGVISAIQRLIGWIEKIPVPNFGQGSSTRPPTPGGRPRGRASGGPVAKGLAYTVGERGRELFVPRTAGSIVPNGALGGVVHEHHYHGPVVQDSQFIAYLKNLEAKDRARNGRAAFGTS